MRGVVQRVTRAEVRVGDEVVGRIGRGFLVLLGVAATDTSVDAEVLIEKIAGLRLFEDAAGRMNLPLSDVGGELLVVSQFTLLGDCRKGRRPSFDAAARPEHAIPLYELVVAGLRARGLRVETGRFQAEMAVELVNDGPVTLLLDSTRLF
jgi:D-tyrosyl-tRNA(Tyr) deacylase